MSYKLSLKSDELKNTDFILGYEAGSLGYSLYRQLTDLGYKCIILAPSTMSKSTKDTSKKTDRKDARMIAKCLAFGLYKPVYVPDEKDNEVKEYIRCRDDIKADMDIFIQKQRINGLHPFSLG